MDEMQFYPTPKRLAEHMWAKFRVQAFARVLDPSAGDGALGDAAPRDYYHRGPPIDCIELDASKHPILREKGWRVVSLNFLQFEGGHCYSHVIMNPPFREGHKHVLKAWDMLYAGEIVALLNAETLRNPFSVERKRLVQLVEQHGSVQFISDAFKGSEVTREADVEVAIVHLDKPAECSTDWIGPVIETLSVDSAPEDRYELPRELALPDSFVTRQVKAFRLAVKAMRDAVRSEGAAQRLAARIGRTMDDLANNRCSDDDVTPEELRKRLQERYELLKDRAWASVLRSTEAMSRLSSKVQKQAESQFNVVKQLEFTEGNVYGFLLGLVQSQPEMQLDMMCEVFDLITRYWSENTVFYKGWKSNDKHRSMGMRIKASRIILPHMRAWGSGLDFSSLQTLSDLDKAFALLDGRTAPEISLAQLFEQQYGSLKQANRLDASYFSVRFYGGAGTVHLYPRNKELVDRLNRVVGRRRAWLPPTDQQGSKAFWTQYTTADKLQEELCAQLKALSPGYSVAASYSPMAALANSNDEDAKKIAEAKLAQAMDTVLEKHGLLEAIGYSPACQEDLLMLTA